MPSDAAQGYIDTLLSGAAARAKSLTDIGMIRAQGAQQVAQTNANLTGQLSNLGPSLIKSLADQRTAAQETKLRQQQIAQNDTIEQERVRKQKDAAGLDAIYASTRGQGRDALNAAIHQDGTPEQIAAWEKETGTLDAQAATTRKAVADAQEANTLAATHTNELLASTGAAMHRAGDTPEAFRLAHATLQSQFADNPQMLKAIEQQVDGYRQAITDGSMSIKDVADALVSRSPAAMNAQREAQTAATLAPSITPNAAGLTPSQQAEADARTAMLKQQQTAGAVTQANEQQRIGLERQRVGIEQGRADVAKQTFDLTYGTAPSEPGQTTVPADPIAKSIAEYGIPPVSPRSMTSGPGQALMKRVLAINPAYDASLYANRAPTRKAFTTGPQGQQGTAMNAALGHMDQMGEMLKNLDNSDVQIKNRAFNFFKTQFGADSVTNFENLKSALTGEMDGILSKGGVSVEGRRDAAAKITSAQSPAQLAGYVETNIPIIGSKLNALDYTYHQQMDSGRDAKDPFSILSPEGKAVLVKHGFGPNNPTVKTGSGAGAGAAGGPTGGTVRMKAPDGKIYDVPADKVAAAKANGWK